MARQRRSFTEEFKREAVRLVDQSGSSKADIARDLGISGSLLARGIGKKRLVKRPLPSRLTLYQWNNSSACVVS
jgi:transposase-like protein